MDDVVEFEFDFDPEQQAIIERSLKEKLVSFFSKYKFYCGGPIPNKLLRSNDSVNILLNTQFDSGIKFIYEFVLPSFNRRLIKSSQFEVEWDIELVLNLLASCRESYIPIQYQAGILILYFKYCCGAKELSYDVYNNWQINDTLTAA